MYVCHNQASRFSSYLNSLIVGLRRQFLVLKIIQLSELIVQKRIEDLNDSSNWRDKSTLVLRTIR